MRCLFIYLLKYTARRLPAFIPGSQRNLQNRKRRSPSSMEYSCSAQSRASTFRLSLLFSPGYIPAGNAARSRAAISLLYQLSSISAFPAPIFFCYIPSHRLRSVSAIHSRPLPPSLQLLSAAHRDHQRSQPHSLYHPCFLHIALVSPFQFIILSGILKRQITFCDKLRRLFCCFSRVRNAHLLCVP